MTSAFVRLGAIAAASLILMIFAVVLVRVLGLQQAFAPPPHPWFERPYWNVYEPKDLCSQFQQPTAGTMVLVTVHFDEGTWRTACGTLDQLLKSSAHPDWILRVKANDAANLDKLVDIVSPHDENKKFAILTDSQRAARFLRTKSPQWLFAADPTSLVRLQMFASLWIETAMDFWPDFVIASNDAGFPTHLTERLARELERRQKRIVWSGNENPSIPVQGRVSEQP